jgi:hypothetical protein
VTQTATAHTLLLRLQHAVLAGLEPCPHADDDTAPHWVAWIPRFALCQKCAVGAPRPLACDVCSRPATLSRVRLSMGESTVHAYLCSSCLLPDRTPGDVA